MMLNTAQLLSAAQKHQAAHNVQITKATFIWMYPRLNNLCLAANSDVRGWKERALLQQQLCFKRVDEEYDLAALPDE